MKKNKKMILFVSAVFLTTLSFFGTVSAAGPAPVNLLSASNFAILTQAGITTTGATKIVGDVGVSPIAATAMTGFGLVFSPGSTFSKSSLVTGKVYSPNYANPTPSKMATAVSDMRAAYINAIGRVSPTATELAVGNIGGRTITPGLYKWSSFVSITKDLTLKGGANDVWIFQIAQTLNVSPGVKIILSGGAQAKNIFWAVSGQTTIGTTAVFNGNILDKTGISFNTGAVLNGRALAQTAVTLDSNSINAPALDIVGICDYAAPLKGCTYINGPDYNASTHCGMILSCSNLVKYNFTKTLAYGSTGADVIALQKYLISKGYMPANTVIVSFYGHVTSDAVKKLQSANELTQTGTVNSKTLIFLNL